MARSESDLWELETRSEAVYLDAVTMDAETGFVARICRFPDEGLAWNWLHIFHHGHIHSFMSHEVGCSNEPVDETAGEVSYEAGEFSISRTGDRLSPRASLTASAMLHSGHSGDLSPHGEGVLPAEISARFERALSAVQNRAGRTEILGITDVHIELGDAEIEYRARGQFHEQIQTDPRFNRPFTYASLRGEDAGCIFIRGTAGARGTLLIDGEAETITGVRLTEPGVIRRIEIDTDARTLEGEVVATYEYEIPIFHLTRAGSLVRVVLGGLELSGCINDLVMGEMAFDRI